LILLYHLFGSHEAIRIRAKIKTAPPKKSLTSTFLKFVLPFSSNNDGFRLKYSLKISNTIENITVKNPLKIKNEKGKKDIAHINSPKPRVAPRDIKNACFLFFNPNSSPLRRLIKNPLQNTKKTINIKSKNPRKKLIIWLKIKSQIILEIKNIIIAKILSRSFG